MKPSRWITVIVALLIVAAGSVALTYRHLKAGTPLADPSSEKTPSTMDIRIVTTQPVTRTFSSHMPWIGVVRSCASVKLTALVDGSVAAIDVADQTPVETGAVIMRLGEPRVESERAGLEVSAKSLTSQLALANETIARLQQSLAERLATKDDLAAAQKTRLQLQGQLHHAQLALDSFEQQLRVVAPMAGIFTHRRVSPGQAVRAGQVLGQIIDADHLRIVAALFPPVGVALEGKQVKVRLSGDRLLTGIIKQVLPQAAPNGATKVWIESKQIDRQVHPGQTVSGEVTLAAKSALAVPASAVVYDADEQPYVFVPYQGDYKRRPVHLGLTHGGWIEVLSGLNAGQPVVTQGAYELFYRRFNQQFKIVD